MRATVALASATLLLAACILDRSGGGAADGNGGAATVGSGGTTSVSPASGGSGGTTSAGGAGGMGGMPVVGCVVQAAARRHITCAVRNDGSAWCWGNNNSGALGIGTSGGAITTPTQVSGLSNIAEVAVASRMAYARTVDGVMYSWGLNDVGQMGIGMFGGSYATPVMVEAIGKVEQISAGRGHVCALDQAGDAHCWGWNTNGQIGDSSNNNRSTPVNVLSDVSHIAAGGRSTCAVRTDNTVWCWGRNHFGQSGQPANASFSTPTQVPNLLADEVAVGGRHACARNAAGQVWCWGSNAALELGGEAGPGTHIPQQVPGVSAQRIYAAGFRSCARLNSGDLSCWGEPVLLGSTEDDAPEGSSEPIVINELSLNGKVGFAIGSQHMCGGNAAGEFICAGRNNQGQLGDGTQDSRQSYEPAQLMCPRPTTP